MIFNYKCYFLLVKNVQSCEQHIKNMFERISLFVVLLVEQSCRLFDDSQQDVVNDVKTLIVFCDNFCQIDI